VIHLVKAVPSLVCNSPIPQFETWMKNHSQSHTLSWFPSVTLRECTSSPCTFIPGVGLITNQKKIIITISVHFTDVRFAKLQRKTLSFFLTNIYLSILQRGHPWRLDKYTDDIRALYFSPEATFHVSGVANGQNCRNWGNENPHVTCEVDRASAA
jgi:hypothetical protein